MSYQTIMKHCEEALRATLEKASDGGRVVFCMEMAGAPRAWTNVYQSIKDADGNEVLDKDGEPLMAVTDCWQAPFEIEKPGWPVLHGSLILDCQFLYSDSPDKAVDYIKVKLDELTLKIREAFRGTPPISPTPDVREV